MVTKYRYIPSYKRALALHPFPYIAYKKKFNTFCGTHPHCWYRDVHHHHVIHNVFSTVKTYNIPHTYIPHTHIGLHTTYILTTCIHTYHYHTHTHIHIHTYHTQHTAILYNNPHFILSQLTPDLYNTQTYIQT